MKRSAPLVVVVVLALALSGCLGLTPGVGKISVDSTPPGARILLDGADTGKVTPAVLDKVRTGSHEITVVAAGYEPETRPVVVARGKTVTVTLELEQAVEPGPDPTHARVYGYVSENFGGRLLPEATVTAYESGTHIAVASAVTDEHGAYTLYIPPGTYDIVADKPAHAQAKRQSLTVRMADEAEVHLYAKKIDDPAKKAIAPTIHVYLEAVDENGETVRVPFEPYTVIPQGMLAFGVVSVEAEYDMYQVQIRIGHQDHTPDWQGGLLGNELAFALWDVLDAPGDTELSVVAYDWQNNRTEVRIPFTYAVGEPQIQLDPVEMIDLIAFTYGHDLELYRMRRAKLYDELGLFSNPNLVELGDGTVIDLSRFDKDVTMYVVVRWSEVIGAAGYEIQRAFHRDGPWQRIARLSPSFPQPYFDFGPELAPGRAVYYRVRAIGPNNEKGGWSSPTWVIPLDRLEIRLTEPADDATNVPFTPTFRWTYTDVGADEYTFDIYVAGVT